MEKFKDETFPETLKLISKLSEEDLKTVAKAIRERKTLLSPEGH